jgi:hypothetical protein
LVRGAQEGKKDIAAIKLRALISICLNAQANEPKRTGRDQTVFRCCNKENNDMRWQETVTDPDEIKVFMALDGPQYTWRTMSGIARQTGLSEARVAQIFAKYNLTLTRLSETPSVSGSALVGLIEKIGV